MTSTATNPEILWRVNTYRLLARLFATPVDQKLLGILNTANPENEEKTSAITRALNNLSLAAQSSTVEQIAEQYHELFIGMTRGELLPYGSYYQTGFLMEKPLATLRDDLHKLGFQRQPEVCEPEDHIAALCEVMSILVQENRAIQHDFFNQHLNNWAGTFFNELASIQSSIFYRSVAELGLAFFKIEAANLANNNYV